jgi:hypothetical protein
MANPDQVFQASRSGGPNRVVSFTLTSDGSGDASVSETLHGWIVRCVTNPTNSPTDNWDFVLNDVDGVDVLGGGGANRDIVNSEEVSLPNNNPVRIDGVVTCVGSNMGNAKTAVVRLYIVPGAGY